MERTRVIRMAGWVCVLVAVLCGVGQSRVIYVDGGTGGAGDGSSWSEAFVHLQDALAVAEAGDEIRVAQGVYRPDQGAWVIAGDRDATFALVSGVTLAGGYAGLGGADPDENDVECYETILSGDLAGDDGPDFTNIGDNSRVVVSSLSNDATTTLRGFTITGGWGEGGAGVTCLESDLQIADCTIRRNKTKGTRTNGAGMSNSDGSPTLKHCVFTDNLAWGSGGGIWSTGGHPAFMDCSFEANRAELNGGGLYIAGGTVMLERCAFHGNEGYQGAGMYASPEDESACTDCLFIENLARLAEYGGGSGGGVYVAGAGPMTFRDCRFEANSAQDGGGLANRGNTATVIDGTFHQNRARGDGGGIVNRSTSHWEDGDRVYVGDLILTRCAFTGNVAGRGGALDNTHCAPTLTDCTFEGNVAQRSDRSGWGGGAVYTLGGFGRGGGTPVEVAPTLVNCRFTGNRADGLPGGGFYNDNNSTALVNCLFAGNAADEGGGIYSEGASPTLTRCTLAQNRGGPGGGLLDATGGTVLDHCIVWDNDEDEISGAVMAVNSDIEGGWPGAGNIDIEPCFASLGSWGPNARVRDWIEGDYHLKSQGGRWDNQGEVWVQDEVTSECIDAGDPYGSLGDELFPNGGIVNLGAYGGTVEASKSYFGKPVCEMHLAGDINGDCAVDLQDLAIVVSQWTDRVPWPVEEEPLVAIVAPRDGDALVIAPEPIFFLVDIHDRAEVVKDVSFRLEGELVNGHSVSTRPGQKGANGWYLLWESVPHRGPSRAEGTYTVTATAHYQDGTSTVSAPVTFTLQNAEMPTGR